MDEFWKHRPIKDEENNVDPDDAKSTPCFACKLPIFSTPVVELLPSKRLLHDACANLPEELHGHALHPQQPLVLRRKKNAGSKYLLAECSKCSSNAGGDMMYYECPDSRCGFKLDLVCGGQIRILHRIHQHRLTPIRTCREHSEQALLDSPTFSCDACGVRHANRSDLSYLCTLCSFRLHPECASLPNAVVENHRHALRLSYHLAASFRGLPHYECEICGGDVASLGVYFCGKCRYYVHIKCAMADPWRFKSVMVRDAKFADVLHFPLEDEYTSVVRFILENTTENDWHPHQIEGKFSPEEIHEHPLIFHDRDDNDPLPSGVCSACVRLISPPFYSCSECPNFLLHDCCTRLPRKIQHRRHKKHALHLIRRASRSDTPAICCRVCEQDCNGFIYSCKTCSYMKIDVVCALMPPTITHDSHGKSHILYLSDAPFTSTSLVCCDEYGIHYECSSTCHFQLHARCAALPRSVRHKDDEHPLKLTATSAVLAATDDQGRLFCEACERSITHTETKRCYSCDECDQFFQSECVPSLVPFVGNGATVRVGCHACPLALVRNYGFHDYKCGYCSRDIDNSHYDLWVYECSQGCYFRIHLHCARKCGLES